ncbi:MAG: Transcriptional regulator, GntR family [Pseudolabrys sp.]|jgi:DNA-binding FadR family transcriptional regulator|nr:Transcriptional regulator, GntR family [Pseudolabrys sp.]
MADIGLQRREVGSSREAIERLSHMIDSGKFPRHSRLPPERDLAIELGVGRSTLRKALAIFEAEGKIWRHVGRGTFVGNSAPPENSVGAMDLSGATPEELLEARLVLEPAIAAFACSAAHAADIDKMKLANAKREVAPDPKMYNLWDFTFHEAIAEATQNPLLIALMKGLNALRKRPEWSNYKQTRLSPQLRRQSAQEHGAIIAAIEQREPVAAYESMRAHIGNVRTAFQSWEAAAQPVTKAKRA